MISVRDFIVVATQMQLAVIFTVEMANLLASLPFYTPSRDRRTLAFI